MVIERMRRNNDPDHDLIVLPRVIMCENYSHAKENIHADIPAIGVLRMRVGVWKNGTPELPSCAACAKSEKAGDMGWYFVAW